MRLNFATLSNPMQKTVGHGGTGGTPSIHGALSRPTTPGEGWDTVGQPAAPMIKEQAGKRDSSHLSHRNKKEVGRRKPSIHGAVPRVPPVPPKKQITENEREAFEERAAIMEFDGGLSRAEAERWAAASLGYAAAIQEAGNVSAAPLATRDEAAILSWLDRIGEIDPVTIAEVLASCQRDKETRDYLKNRASENYPLDQA